MAEAIEFEINGVRRRANGDPNRFLLWVLREEFELIGTKYGCGEGECGACTVLIDGHAERSCITPLSAVAGKRVTTIEGLERNGRLDPVQQAFLEEDAMQCGYCTPGMIMSAVSLLNRKANPSEEEIVRAMNGNICRCGTYQRIIRAVKRAAQSKRGTS